MTIVVKAETRNSQWANDTSSFGHKMLAKMGWKGEGAGLGKEQQGTSVNLRAVRRIDGLGIGAENDAFGDKGWSETNASFHGVLANLKREYGSGGTGSREGSGDDDNQNEDDDDGDEVGGSKEKKRKKKKEKKRLRNKIKATKHNLVNDDTNGSSGGGEGAGGVRLPQNRVQVGHARKMREAKDIRNKSVEDMAAIFGVKAEQYKPPPPPTIYSSSNDTALVHDNDEGKLRRKQKWKERKERWKELPLAKVDDHGVELDGKKKKDKKKNKRKRLNEGDDDQGNVSEDCTKRKKNNNKKVKT